MIANTLTKPAATPAFRTGDERLIKLTAGAAKKVGSLLAKQGRPTGVLRVAVVGGGCSGLQYKMDLQDAPANRDILVESAGIRVVVDPKSALYVTGSELDYLETLDGGFKVKNPKRGHQLLLRRELQRLNDRLFRAIGPAAAALGGRGDAQTKISFPRIRGPSGSRSPSRRSRKARCPGTFGRLERSLSVLARAQGPAAPLLELERGSKPNELQEIPPALMEMFMEVSALCGQVDAFLAEKAAVTSPLLKVELFGRAQAWIEPLNRVATTNQPPHRRIARGPARFGRKMAAPGPDLSARAALLGGLEALYRLFSYFGRWQGQIQERFLQLSL